MENVFIIGIAGGTGSGKTTVVEKILNEFLPNDLCVIPQDSYYKKNDNLTHQERCLINFDHPKAIDFNLLVSDLKKLKNGESIAQPVYCFKTHNRTDKTITTYPKKVIIIEGILIFNSEELRNLCDLKIFIHADADERLIRRILRDVSQRGRDVEGILSRYRKTLKPMHNQFIEPTRFFADIVIPNDKENNAAINIIKSVIRENL